MTDVFTQPWLSGLFGDEAAQAIWTPGASLSRMIAFEAAWSRALGQTGAVDGDMAERAARAIEDWTPDEAALRQGTGRDGLPVPELVKGLKQAAGDAADAVHVGATSQDVMDSALAMASRDTLALLDERIFGLEAALRGLADRAGDARIMGRTRMQAALPIMATHRIGVWAQPLARHRDRLAELRPRVACVQVGGPVGDRRNLAPGMVGFVADQLGLAEAPCWHAARDGIAEFGGVAAMIAGSCGKIGADVCLMAQQGVDEARVAGGGGSSAMPHKQNPVAAETLVTLARYASAQAGALSGTMVHEQERSGAAWTLEWMVLPPLAVSAARALGLCIELVEGLEIIDSKG